MAKNLSLTPHERYNPHHIHCTVHHVCQRARICAWGPSRTQQTHRRSCSFLQAGSARRAPTSQQPDLTRDARHTYSTECACMAHCPRHNPVTFMWWVDHGVDKRICACRACELGSNDSCTGCMSAAVSSSRAHHGTSECCRAFASPSSLIGAIT